LNDPPSCTTPDVQDHRGSRREVIYSWGTPDAFKEHVVPNVTYGEGEGEYSVRVTWWNVQICEVGVMFGNKVGHIAVAAPCVALAKEDVLDIALDADSHGGRKGGCKMREETKGPVLWT